MFKHAFEAGLIDKPVRYGPVFKKPSKKAVRKDQGSAAGPDDASEAVTRPITSLTCEHGVVPSLEGMLFRKLVVSELCWQRNVF